MQNEQPCSIRLLFGICNLDENTAKAFVKELEQYNIKVERYECRYKKMGVLSYLKHNPDTDFVIVSHFLEERFPYTGNEYEKLVENYEDTVIIPILSDDMVDDSILYRLHQLGVFNGIFDSDAKMSNLADLIHKGRSRKEAKIYYKLKSGHSEQISIDYKSTVRFLEEGSADDLEVRVHHVLEMLTPGEFARIYQMLSDDVKNKILQLDIAQVNMYVLTDAKKDTSKVKQYCDKLKDSLQEVFKKNAAKAKTKKEKKTTEHPKKKQGHIKEKKVSVKKKQKEPVNMFSGWISKISLIVLGGIIVLLILLGVKIFGNNGNTNTADTPAATSTSMQNIQESDSTTNPPDEMSPVPTNTMEAIATPTPTPVVKVTQVPTKHPQTPAPTKKPDASQSNKSYNTKKNNVSNSSKKHTVNKKTPKKKEVSKSKKATKQEKNEHINPDENELVDGLD